MSTTDHTADHAMAESNQVRQAKRVERMRAEGRVRLQTWVSAEQAEAIRKYLDGAAELPAPQAAEPAAAASQAVPEKSPDPAPGTPPAMPQQADEPAKPPPLGRLLVYFPPPAPQDFVAELRDLHGFVPAPPWTGRAGCNWEKEVSEVEAAVWKDRVITMGGKAHYETPAFRELMANVIKAAGG